MAELLKIQNVTKVFDTGGIFNKKKTIALQNITLHIKKDSPSILGIAGESGSGKTTLAGLLLGFITPTEGKILYKGKDLQKLSKVERLDFRQEVQVIFQDPFEVYNPFYKIDHMLNIPVTHFHLANSKKEGKKLVENALEKIGLHPEETLGRFPHQLSGGQRQRIMVARAFLLKPSIIIADEPVSMVDASLRATILKSLLQMKQDLNIPILYISHDLTTTYQISDNIIILYKGSVVETGKTELLIKKPKHPYTQLLIKSIPLPDPDVSWMHDNEIFTKENATDVDKGCNFLPRCPFSMDICKKSPPPLYQTDDHRAVRCYLYKNGSIISDETINKVLDS